MRNFLIKTGNSKVVIYKSVKIITLCVLEIYRRNSIGQV